MTTQLYNIKKLPKILYKYRDFNNEFHLKTLFEGQLFIASPNNFNDIYDCKIPVRYDLADDVHLKEQLIKSLKQISKEASNDINDKVAKVLLNSNLFDKLKELSTDELFLSFLYSSTGIYSLTHRYDNLLMWAHYAKDHTGFCIGFDTEYLLDTGADYLGKVEYLKEYPMVLPSFLDDENLKKTVFSKSIDWKYEQEFRLFFKNITKRNVKIDKEGIKKIYLGAKMNKFDKDIWMELINKYLENIKIFEAKTDNEKFKLRFKRIS